MSTPFYLVGPTAVGKTDLAVDLAEEIGAEIVNADAFQVYVGLDRLTAKPTVEQRWRVPHHLVGNVPLSEDYSVARYLREARSRLAEIAARGKKALVVGGSGMYVKTLTHGLAELPEAQPELRRELEALTTDVLLARLKPLDPVTALQIDPCNKRRLVRALEVCLVTGEPFSASRTEWQVPVQTNPVGLFLLRERVELVERIELRTATLLAQEALHEVEQAVSAGLSATSARIIGLAEVQSLLSGRMEAAACRDLIAVKTRQYAKRQVTWFKREVCFTSLNLSHFPTYQQAGAAVRASVRSLRPDFWR